MLTSVLRTAALAAATALLACEASESGSEPTASVRLELESATDLGNVFQLRGAVFEIAGPTMTSVASDGVGPFVEADVRPGDYRILLKDGWSLAHTSGPSPWIDTTGAELVSENPLLVNVPGGAVTTVFFQFAIGKKKVGKNEGRVQIGIEVTEPTCGNGLLDAGEECDSALSYPDATCDRLCTGGDRPCVQDADCASGLCRGGDCPECNTDAYACGEACVDGDSACGLACGDTASGCADGCVGSEGSCRDACGTASEICWAGCFADPLTCLAICEPPRTACMDVCTSGRAGCDASCSAALASCALACAGTRATCDGACDEGQDACWDACLRCKPCTDAGQCPYLAF